MNIYKVIGVMSGTSLDGLDIAYVEFYEDNGRWKFELKDAVTIPYDSYWEEEISQVYDLSAHHYALFNVQYGHFLGEMINDFMVERGIKPDLIASHGHTIFHQPENNFTAQIGDGAAIAAICKTPVVSDFRTTDVALGGQGAPLVPIGDKYLFSDYDYCLNLGGIANISFDFDGQRIAGDICPVNMVLNILANKLDLDFDKDGINARKGNLNPDLLDKLNQLPFFIQPFPKSLGKEWVDKNFIPNIYSSKISIEDKLRTVCEHISIQINKILTDYDNGNQSPKKMLITGGGALNKFLVELIKQKCSLEIVIPNEQIINFKEAVIFGLLGVLRFRGEINCLKSVTGAERDSIGGAIHLY